LLPSADELVVGAVAAIPLLITAYLPGVYWQAAKALLAHQPVYA
jgi:hypothetical protein